MNLCVFVKNHQSPQLCEPMKKEGNQSHTKQKRHRFFILRICEKTQNKQKKINKNHIQIQKKK